MNRNTGFLIFSKINVWVFVKLEKPLYDSSYIVRNTYIAVLKLSEEVVLNPQSTYLVQGQIKLFFQGGVQNQHA